MKRKPIEIMAGLINALNSFSTNEEYSINKIHEETNYHWNTVNDYIKLIMLVKNFAPDLKFNKETNELNIINQSPFFKQLKGMQQLVLYLFISKAFNEGSAIQKEHIRYSDGSVPEISQKFEEYIHLTDNKRYYLSLKGKFRAQGILASIYGKMSDFIEKEQENSAEPKANRWLVNFYGSEKQTYLEKIKKAKEEKVTQMRQKDETNKSERNIPLEIYKPISSKSTWCMSTENLA